MNPSPDRHNFHDLAPPSQAVPAEGELRLRVRYCECDPMGVAHHAAYIPWLEMGRTELLRMSGMTYAHMEAAGVFLVITRLEARYRRPARYDEDLALATRVVGGGRARIDHEYELWRCEGDPPSGRGKVELLLTASTTLACVDGEGRPRPLPEWLRPESHTKAPAAP